MNLLDLISSQLTQELERKQAEDFLLLTAQAIDMLSTNLKEIHKLSISNYETLEDLYKGYLKSGTRLFQLPIGILSTIKNDEYTITAVQDTENLLPGDVNFSLSDTYCSLVADSKKTVFFNNASEIKEVQNTKFFKEYGFSRYIGSPIYLYGEIAGTLSFYSFDSESSLIEEYLTEVIELMCKSISSEIEKRRAMEEVHRIKLQQDGDYFLTSLLIKPLAQHKIESTHFSVEFLLKQKYR